MHAAFWWKLGFGNSSAFFCSSNRWHLSSALLVWVVFKLVHSFIRSLWRCGRKITAHCGIFYWISFEKTALGHKLCSLLEFKLSKRSACFRSEKVVVSIFPRKSESHSSGIPSVEASKQAGKRGEMQFHPIQPWNALIGNRPENESRFQTLLTLTNIKKTGRSNRRRHLQTLWIWFFSFRQSEDTR